MFVFRVYFADQYSAFLRLDYLGNLLKMSFRLHLKDCGKSSPHILLGSSFLACQSQTMTVYKRKSGLPFYKRPLNYQKNDNYWFWWYSMVFYNVFRLIYIQFPMITLEKSWTCCRNSTACMMQWWVRLVAIMASYGQIWILRRSMQNFWNFRTGNPSIYVQLPHITNTDNLLFTVIKNIYRYSEEFLFMVCAMCFHSF